MVSRDLDPLAHIAVIGVNNANALTHQCDRYNCVRTIIEIQPHIVCVLFLKISGQIN